MNEIEAIKEQLERYGAVLTRQVDRLYNALEELQRTTLLLVDTDSATEDDIENWLQSEGFAVDSDGFFQSLPLVTASRENRAPKDAISFSWGEHLRDNPHVRQDIYRHRNVGPHLKNIHDRLGDVGWIYYQSVHNTALQYPFIDQRLAIPYDFDWSTYHTYVSVSPENNPQRRIRWTLPSIDYAEEGLIIGVSIPVWRGETFLGLWSIDLPLRYLYRDFTPETGYPHQSRFITDRDGMLLLHEKLQAEIDQTKGQICLHNLSELGGQWTGLEMDEILSMENNMLEVTDDDGTAWVFCFRYMPDVEWTLFSGLKKSSMEEAAAQRLRQAFQQIGSGNFSHRIESSQSTALSTLVDAFNEMGLRLDETEKRRGEMEKQLHQARKLEAIGRLAGGVAHDYNNITSVIMGYSELMLGKVDKKDPLFNPISEIHKAAERSRDLTRQLLAFARRQTVAPRVVNLNGIIEEMKKMLMRLVGEDIHLIWRPGEEIWPVEIDPSQVDQILANLCINARDAIDSVGEIIIESGNVEFDERYCGMHQDFTPGEFVQLTVSDDGAGMETDTQEKIFEPFFSTKSFNRGTGLGLATVYGIVKQNNGFINVYSEPEKGSTFKIYLPRAKGKTVESASSNVSGIPMGHHETLLLVEDDPALLTLAEEMLKELDYRVLAANSPEEAITLATHHSGRIDLLITDVIMPRTTGRDLAKQLHQLLPDLGVLFMSGYTTNVIAHRGILDKGVFLIQKPFSRKELAAKVREVLSDSTDEKH